jgi:hypothetical protein
LDLEQLAVPTNSVPANSVMPSDTWHGGIHELLCRLCCAAVIVDVLVQLDRGRKCPIKSLYFAGIQMT